MSPTLPALALCITLMAVSWQTPSAQTPPAAIAITHVTVIDVETGMRVADQTVVIRGNRIDAVGLSTRVAAPSGARVVDGRGKFLIPGLWDLHVHSLEHLGVDYSYGMEPYRLYVANGVTGVRDMGSSFIQLVVGKKRIESGRLVAPRIIASGPLLEAGQPSVNRAIISKYVPTPESGRLAVDTLAEAGVDFLKIHNGLSRDTFLAIAEEAKRKRMVFAGHVPDGVTVVEASDVGQRSIEHMAPIAEACRKGPPPPRGRGEGAAPAGPIEIDEARCDAALRRLAQNGTWLTPTLISSYPQTTATDPDADAHRQYLKPDRRASCAPLPAQERPGARTAHEFNERLVQRASRAGVRMMTGTDTTTCRQPGWAVLQELSLLVKAGLSPLDALRAATINPAVYFDKKDSLGTVTRGKLADLVLLDGDPLLDITSTSRIAAVVADGRLFDEAGRKKLFDEVLVSAQGPPVRVTQAPAQ